MITGDAERSEPKSLQIRLIPEIRPAYEFVKIVTRQRETLASGVVDSPGDGGGDGCGDSGGYAESDGAAIFATTNVSIPAAVIKILLRFFLASATTT